MQRKLPDNYNELTFYYYWKELFNEGVEESVILAELYKQEKTIEQTEEQKQPSSFDFFAGLEENNNQAEDGFWDFNNFS